MPDPIDTLAEPLAEPAADPIECAAEILRDESRDRLWLKVLTPILALRTVEDGPSGQGASPFELMYTEACNRACRILRSDRDGDT